MNKNDKIYVAGHMGLVGSAVVRCLERSGYGNVVTVGHGACDLTDSAAAMRFFEREKPDYVIMAAGRVGGILRNVKEPWEMIFENATMALNTIHAAQVFGVKRFMFLGSSCVYPKGIDAPITEEMLLSGPLEPTNEFYAIAKILGIKACRAVRSQYGTEFFSVMPCNLYGLGDSFHIATCHVLPALIRKIHEAKINSLPFVSLWGDGTPRRQFLHADDLAEAVLLLMNLPMVEKDVVNIGSETEVSIKDLAEMIKEVVGYEGDIRFDGQMPNGVSRKFIDTSYLRELEWKEKIPLRKGIEIVYAWYSNGFCQRPRGSRMSSNENKPTVYVKYMPGYFGLGDYLRGLSVMYTAFDDVYHVVPTIMHPLRHYLKYPGPIVGCETDIFNIKNFPRQDPKEIYPHIERRMKASGEACIVTNFTENPHGVFDKRLRRLFVLNDETQKVYEEYVRSLTLGRNYEILHVRAYDVFNEQAWPRHYGVLKQEIPKIPQVAEVRIVIASDVRYRVYLKSVFPEFVYPVGKLCHLASPVTDDEAVMHTFFEMKLCTEAKKIHTFTVYPWGASGFTRIPARLFDVPYTAVRF